MKKDTKENLYAEEAPRLSEERIVYELRRTIWILVILVVVFFVSTVAATVLAVEYSKELSVAKKGLLLSKDTESDLPSDSKLSSSAPSPFPSQAPTLSPQLDCSKIGLLSWFVDDSAKQLALRKSLYCWTYGINCCVYLLTCLFCVLFCCLPQQNYR